MPLECVADGRGSTGQEDPVVDIVAVHGLNPFNNPNHALDTWRKPGNNRGEGHLWLRDAFPLEQPNARIFIYKYNSSPAFDGSKERFVFEANTLLELILMKRVNDPNRPLILIGHSLGGILIKQALVNAHANARYTAIKDATYGLVFFATPHAGPTENSKVLFGRAIARIVQLLPGQVYNDRLECLTNGTVFADLLQEQWRQQLERYKFVSFIEGIGNLVPRDSAVIGLPGTRENQITIQADHSNICRFDPDIAVDRDNYGFVEFNLSELCREASQQELRPILSSMEAQCHQLFRLTVKNKDVTYEWYKNRVEERIEGTCQWFLEHEHFQTWLKQSDGPLLVTADPGCGKSVLAKYLVDHGLSRPTTTVCYFFFKDQDQNTARQALCALLHQLFGKKPSLIRHAMTEFRKDGKSLIDSTESLWKVLRNAANDPKAGSIIIVLDALDECAESEVRDLIRNIEGEFRGNLLDQGKLKYLLTCRPYENIVSKFYGLIDAFPNIRIPGEEESKAISEEVNRVITHRVNLLSKTKNLSEDIKNHLEKKLKETTHRTYLWAYLAFKYLEEELFKKTRKGVELAIATLPSSVNEAYDKILNKSKDEERPMVRKALSIILAARRPLTLSEMNVAVNVDNTSETFDGLDLEDEHNFRARLRSWCGLFVSIYRGKIYFLHQTVREFLLVDLASPAAIPSELRWHHSITTQHAHTVLAEACVLYLNFFNSDDGPATDESGEATCTVSNHAFSDYSAKNWGAHFREADVTKDAAILLSALRICDPNSKSYSAWFRIYQESTTIEATIFTDLIVGAFFGHNGIVEVLVEKGADIAAKDSKYSRTPVSWAAGNGHEAVVRLLLGKGAHIETKDSYYGQTPLLWAAENGRESVVKLLLENGANVEARDGRYGQTPLSRAAGKGYKAVVKLLLERGANIEAEDSYYIQTPLLWAAANGRESVVELLLDRGANVEAQDDRYGQAPLSRAAEKGREAVVKLLLGKGAKIEAEDHYGRTALSRAAENDHESVVKLLLDKGAYVEAKDNRRYQTPLWWAATTGHEAIVKLLLDKGANVEAQDDRYGQAPLSRAAEKGREAVVKLLLGKGANIEAEDQYGRTALSRAAENDHESVVKLLLDKGAYVEAKDNRRYQTPLWWAATTGHEAIVKLLLDKGANVEAQDDRYGQAPLSRAAEKGREAVVKLLLDKGANIEAENHYGQTPLSLAAENGRESVVKLLLDKGANLEAKDSRYGQTPMSKATRSGHEAVVLLLLQKGSVRTEDTICRTPLSLAAMGGHDAIVMALLRHHLVKPDQRDYYGSTPLSIAVRNCRTEIVKMLLATRQVTLDCPDRFGRTLWCWATRYGNADIKQALLNHAENGGGAVCENDKFIDANVVPNNMPSKLCDVCTLGILESQLSYHCNFCSGGDFDICSECYEIGGRCLGNDHELAPRN